MHARGKAEHPSTVLLLVSCLALAILHNGLGNQDLLRNHFTPEVYSPTVLYICILNKQPTC